MEDKKFKVLTHAFQFVDERLLHKGIYETSVPKLRSTEDTTEIIIQDILRVIEILPSFNADTMIENLKQCVLMEVEVNLIN